jgi:hypothetical protein
MSVPLWAVELSEAFWEAAGMREPFPRALRRPIARALPLVVVSLPRLRLRDVQEWLTRNRVGYPCVAGDRPLRACLAAHGGWGYVFLDGADSDDEQRLSLAHELAHFLRHYWHPRREACRQLGEQVVEVLDGRRLPTLEERMHALIARVPIGFHWHLMQRDGCGDFASEAVVAAEREADRLAYELLAPADEVLRRAGNVQGDSGRAVLAELLRNEFGLPVVHAGRYSRILLPFLPADPFLQRLGLAP